MELVFRERERDPAFLLPHNMFLVRFPGFQYDDNRNASTRRQNNPQSICAVVHSCVCLLLDKIEGDGRESRILHHGHTIPQLSLGNNLPPPSIVSFVYKLPLYRRRFNHDRVLSLPTP